MIEVLKMLCGVVCGSVRVVVCLFLLTRLLSAQKPQKKSIAAGAAGAAVIAVLMSFAGLSGFYRIVLEVLWIAFCANRLQQADLRMSLFISVFYEIAVSFWQFLLASGMGIVFRSTAFLDNGTWSGQTVMWLFHLLLGAVSVFLHDKRNISGKDAFRAATAAVLAGFLAVITLSEQTMLAIPEDTLDLWMILAVVLMMSVLVFNMNRQYEAEKELAELKAGQAELLERDYTALNKAYAVNAKLFHDFHNHIGALRQLLAHEKYSEAVRYLDELQAPVRGMADTVWTGDDTLDYLINSKAAASASDKIDFQAQVEFPRHTNIQSADLCAILGNLLDNALEAAGQVPSEQQRFVRLTVRRIHQMLVIKVENSCLNTPVQENGILKTTKDDGGLHGWGLQSAQTAADKYDGTVQTTCADGIFRAVATLSYHGIAI
ncbi:MAG: GHKL domain-containing protein [Lachnospiraceae bacterium]|nr:GHKL domain-containing protein [Lachnospiraceae bacterium]